MQRLEGSRDACMQKPRNVVVFSPGVISLLVIRIFIRGVIYYVEKGNSISGFLLRKAKKLLKFINIIPFSYRIGIGSHGNGYINSIYKIGGELTEELCELLPEANLVGMFNREFASRKLGQACRKYVYGKVREIILNYYGLLNNYSRKSIVYVPAKSREAFVIRRLSDEAGERDLDVRAFGNSLTNALWLAGYFVLLVKRLASCGIDFSLKARKRAEYKVMTEAVRYLELGRPFNMLEWWDRSRIKQEEILVVSLNDKEPGRAASFRDARQMGFQCVEMKKRRKIPVESIGGMLRRYFAFPVRIVGNLLKSNNIDMFLFYLAGAFHWTLFFQYYKVNAMVLSTEGFEPFFVQPFGCLSIMYNLSYIGNFEDPLYKYISADHLLVWGESQVYHSKGAFSVDNLHYTGCHGLSYVNRGRKHELMAGLPHMQPDKPNVVFFDNKVLKNGANPESAYFRFLDLILRCSEMFDANVFLRPKSLNPFDRKVFDDKERVELLEKRFGDANIGILNDRRMDVISVLSMADIVVYSMVGTPNMMALMAGIPALCYYDHIDETPDQIMKYYLNELVFDDEEKLIKRISKILSGDESAELKSEDKKKLNHYLDLKGLERLQGIIGDVVCGNEYAEIRRKGNRCAA